MRSIRFGIARKSILLFGLLVFPFAVPLVAFGQFSSSIQGTVTDPSGAAVPQASLHLKNLATGVVQISTSGTNGIFHFVSLGPGQYQIDASAQGFSGLAVTVDLVTGQTLDVPIALQIATQRQAVVVTGEAPLLDTAETRSQVTLGQVALTSLPLGEQTVFPLMALAPGVQGLGTDVLGDIGTSTSDFSPQITFDLSANGRGSGSNMFEVDGLDVTSAVCDGCINLTPAPNSVQEMSIQTDTFSVEHGRGSGLDVTLTTKPGTSKFHGNVSNDYDYQQFWAKTEFLQNYAPFHTNDGSGSIGGPILAKHQLFFFGSVQLLRSLTATGNTSITYEDPAFTNFAKTTFPNTVGTGLLTAFPPSRGTTSSVALTAAKVFPTTCGTSAAANIPCNLPMVDSGVFNAANYLNGLQYHGRVDKYFKKDRIFGSFYNMNMSHGGPTVRPGMETTNPYDATTIQADETHTLSARALNQGDFGFTRVFGNAAATGMFSIPGVTVTGMNTGFGATSVSNNFGQHNYHWRDVFTLISGAHTVTFGYEGSRATEYDHRGPAHDHPNFTFSNLLGLVEDAPHSETNLAYNPLTGNPEPAVYSRSTFVHGVFAEDTWKATRRLTLTPGVRWDDYGNPYFHDMATLPGNFFFGPGTNFNEQVANGSVIVQNGGHMLNRSPMAFSPRIGIAWDPTGAAKWVIRGGAGIYHDWAALGQSTDSSSTNPAAFVEPTFLTGTTTPPIFVLGKSNTPPFGFPYPVLSAIGLNDQGGLLGEQVNIGGIEPNLRISYTYNYAVTLERAFGRNLVANVGYAGSRSTGLLSGADGAGLQSFGTDINRFAGDLVINDNVLKRLNPSFGTITYSFNQSSATYNGVTVAVKGKLGHNGFIDASYTRSSAYDNDSQYPTANMTSQYWGPGLDNAPNRFSMIVGYSVPSFKNANALVNRITGDWAVSSSTILQSGYPFTVYTSAPFEPTFNTQGQVIGLQPGSGDYNADGDDTDWPNVPSTGYKTSTSRHAYLTGLLPASSFGVPTLGTEGNELWNRFNGPGFAKTDFVASKDNHIREILNLQLRFEFYNIFNRPNLWTMVSDLSSGSFGRATAQYNPRYFQMGANLTW